jgi:hypothetical protein
VSKCYTSCFLVWVVVFIILLPNSCSLRPLVLTTSLDQYHTEQKTASKASKQMANYLPPAIMAFFQPRYLRSVIILVLFIHMVLFCLILCLFRPKLEYAPPMDKRPPLPYCGIGHLMHRMKEYAETIPLPVIKPTPAQIKDARKQKLKAKAEQKLQRHKVVSPSILSLSKI